LRYTVRTPGFQTPWSGGACFAGLSISSSSLESGRCSPQTPGESGRASRLRMGRVMRPGNGGPWRRLGCGREGRRVCGAPFQKRCQMFREDRRKARRVRASCTPPCDQRMPGSLVRRFETRRQVDSTMPEPKGQPTRHGPDVDADRAAVRGFPKAAGEIDQKV
jgi:hypothetical protein